MVKGLIGGDEGKLWEGESWRDVFEKGGGRGGRLEIAGMETEGKLRRGTRGRKREPWRSWIEDDFRDGPV